jgi:hypothetical protein
MRSQFLDEPGCPIDPVTGLLHRTQRLVLTCIVTRILCNGDVVGVLNNRAQSAQWQVPLPVSVKVLPASGMNVQS